MPAGATLDPATLYRRQARRLRAELRDQPVKLHRSLAALAQWNDIACPQPKVWKRQTRTDHVQDLVAGVVERMEGPVLRYPARVALLKQAQRAGLAHFDANLIITAVQHRMGERIVRIRRPDRLWIRNLGVALILQCWIIAGCYWLFSL